jgi:hypothetical protein
LQDRECRGDEGVEILGGEQREQLLRIDAAAGRRWAM